MELMQANQQWSSRPSDERFTSLYEMRDRLASEREASVSRHVSTRQIQIEPANETDIKGLVVRGPQGNAFAPTHWAFGQLAARAQNAPAGFLRTLPSPMAADVLNYKLRTGDAEEIQLLLYSNGKQELRAATGPKYGRIWNAPICDSLIRLAGDGVSGRWKVPGEFGKAVHVTKENTTLFAGDRNMFVFLADEEHKIEVPNRRDGKPGLMSRGFFVWNSEVGDSTFGLATFLFDYVCCNRIVWGAQEHKEIRIRHTSGAPQRFLEEIQPALNTYANSSASSLVANIEKARAAKTGNEVETLEFLAKRFTKSMASQLQATHKLEEGRPIENLWDVSTALTARARGIGWQDERVDMEREAGKVLDLAL